MGIADHKLDLSEATFRERRNEVTPEGLGFADPDFEPKKVSEAIGIDAHGLNHRSEAGLQSPSKPDVQRVSLKYRMANHWIPEAG